MKEDYMPVIKLNTVEISGSGGAIKMTRTDVPDYLRRAIADSIDRGKKDASAGAKKEPSNKR